LARTRGSTPANKLQRRRQLLSHFLRGVTDSEELSRRLHCSIRTIQLDLEALKPWLYRKVEAEQLHSLRIAFLQKREICREIWSELDSDEQGDKKASDISRKIRYLELAIKMSAEFDRLCGIAQPSNSHILHTPRQNAPIISAAAEEVKKMSEEQQLIVAKNIRNQERTKASAHT